ncbi:MAG: hypothetical protein FJ171_08290 [Gammaproteobacteria bacterium]|nr:hypothetical protein [Gammaproteobacteria bacterium]
MRASLRNGLFAAAAGISMLIAATPACASSQGRFDDGVYVAPGALFTAKSPLGPRALFFDSFDRSTGAVTFLNEAGELFGVVCTPNMDVLAGADNDYETDAAILRNWLHDVTFPMFFQRQLPSAEILAEEPGRLEGQAAWFAVMRLPQGAARSRIDAESGLPVREDSYRGLVVFSRGEHTYLIMRELSPELELTAVLPALAGFYEGMTFADDHPFFALAR